MKRYEIEVVHEPSGSYLNYVVFSDEEDPDFYNEFIRDISIIVLEEEDVDNVDSVDIRP